MKYSYYAMGTSIRPDGDYDLFESKEFPGQAEVVTWVLQEFAYANIDAIEFRMMRKDPKTGESEDLGPIPMTQWQRTVHNTHKHSPKRAEGTDFSSIVKPGGISCLDATKAGIAWALKQALVECPIMHDLGDDEFNELCVAILGKEGDCTASTLPSHEAFAMAYLTAFVDDPWYATRVLFHDETDEDDEGYWARLRKEASI
ncbi:MAG: hypothetical protein WCS18_12555 [Sphaerochaetaceae bacterium]